MGYIPGVAKLEAVDRVSLLASPSGRDLKLETFDAASMLAFLS